MPIMPLEDPSVLEYMIDSVLKGISIENTGITNSVYGYSVTAYSAARTINDVAIEPVASTIIAIMLVLELARVSTKIDGDRELGIKLVAATIFKSYLLITAATNSELILDALNEAGDTIVSLVATSGGKDTIAASASVVTPEMRASIESMNYFNAGLAVAMLLVPWLMLVLVQTGVKVIVAFRFFELYVLSAFVTLPIVFAGNPETKSIAIGYLRRYGAVLLQTAVILVSLKVYTSFSLDWTQATAFTASDNITGWLFANTIPFLSGPIFLGFILFQSSRIAKSILGEG